MKKIFYINLFMAILLSACAPKAAPVTQTPTTEPSATPAPPTPVPATMTPTQPTACTDAAAFVEDVTVPDYSHFNYREGFKKTWRVKNVGTCTWTSDYKAVYVRGDALGAPASIALNETAPGATLDITAQMTAPTKDGRYEIFYQLQNASAEPMSIDDGNSLWTLITVGKYTARAPATPTTGPTTSTTTSGSSSGPGLATVTCSYKTNPDFVSQTLALINNARTANGLPALTLNDQLSEAAQSHSADMACNGFLSHTGWNGSTVASRIAAAGYTSSFQVENIYAQPPQYGGTPQSAMDWWMGDPIHRDAVLNADATEVGIGYSYYANSPLGGYFAIDFAAP